MTEQEFHIQGIPSDLIDKFWPFAEPYIKRALDRTSGEYVPADLKQFCKDRVTQLWLITKQERVIAAVTTEIIIYPRRKVCRIITLAGSQSDTWMGSVLSPTLAAWAKEQGCSGVDAYVRKGFVPKLLQYGFTHKCSIVSQDI